MKKAKITVVPVDKFPGHEASYKVIALQDTTQPAVNSYITEKEAVRYARDPKFTLIIKEGK